MHSRIKSLSILTAIVAASGSLTVGAYFLVSSGIYRASELGAHVINGPVIVAILGWGLATWLVRILVVGKRPKLPAHRLPILIFGLFRLMLLVATMLAGICWIVALAVGLKFGQDLLEAFVILIVSSALIGIVGGGIINALLTFKLIPINLTVSTSRSDSDLQR